MAFYAEALELVQTAIKNVLRDGQSVGYLGRSWTSANLRELEELEQRYKALAAMEDGGANKGRNRITYVEPLS